MRTMYDAVTARNIPAGARMVAGYIDKIKLEPWSAADWARFPNAVKVEIVKKASTNAGHVLDVEPGDATPAQAPGWVRMRRAAGADPTVYCNSSTWPAVRAAFQAAGVAEPHYWIAKYDGDPTIPAGAVAKQYRGNVAPGYDLSSVADRWPGVDGDTKVTPDEIKAVATAVWNEPLQNALDPAWAASRDILRFAHMEAGRARRELTTAVGNLTQLLLKGVDFDEAALAKELEPVITAAIAAKDFTEHTPEETAAAVKAMLRETFGTGAA